MNRNQLRVPPVFSPAPAKPVSVPRAAILQRASATPVAASAVANTTLNRKRGRMSASKSMFVPSSGDGVYVQDGTAFTSPHFKKTSKKYLKDGAYYTLYEPLPDQFFADCLHTAEEVSASKKLRRGSVRSVISATAIKFGDGDTSNNAAAITHAHNASSSPSVGEAYVIVDTNHRPHATAPYHAAAVVAQDGDARITLESFAGTTDAKKRDDSGTVRMYSVNPGHEANFHTTWTTDYFTGGDGSGSGVFTTVIAPK